MGRESSSTQTGGESSGRVGQAGKQVTASDMFKAAALAPAFVPAFEYYGEAAPSTPTGIFGYVEATGLALLGYYPWLFNHPVRLLVTMPLILYAAWIALVLPLHLRR